MITTAGYIIVNIGVFIVNGRTKTIVDRKNYGKSLTPTVSSLLKENDTRFLIMVLFLLRQFPDYKIFKFVNNLFKLIE